MEAIHYYRCAGDCLEVVAMRCRIEAGDTCAVCGSKRWDYMGQVVMDKMVKHEELTPCNTLCTHASGPKCDCRCGGENHGTGRVVIRRIEKGIPVIPAHDYEKACARRDEFRPYRQEIERRMESARKISRDYLMPYELRRKAWRAMEMNKKMLRLRSHFHRIKHCSALVQYLRDNLPEV